MRLPHVIATILTATSCVLAAPSQDLVKRQATQNELEGGCRDVTLIFARASTERGNMGGSMGPAVCSGLKGKLGKNAVACQGVGGAYKAGLETNVLPEGTNAAAYQEAMKLLTKAHTKCPNSKLLAGGYSQGTAVMMNAISKSPVDIRNKIRGVVLFGYTKNGQQKSGIPNFPKEKVKVFCTQADGVCWGKLSVTAGHFAYMGNGSGPQAVTFLVSSLKGTVPIIAEGSEGGEAGGAEGGGGEEAAPAAAAAKGAKAGGAKAAKGAAGGGAKGAAGGGAKAAKGTGGATKRRRRGEHLPI